MEVLQTKLQFVKTPRRNVEYVKCQVVLPTKIVVEAGWNEGDEIDFDIDREGRVRMFAHEPIPKPMKMTYDEARQSVSTFYLTQPQG